jgi:drug/metabolite transporter (DMT)-like permease
MDATTATAARNKTALDIASIVICTLAWGTTFYAITLQLGVVDPLVSVVYRFALSAGVLFLWCKISGEKVALTRGQHLAALGMGVLTFSINYPLVYVAEQSVTSAVVAVVYAAMAFINLVLFRILFGQRAAAMAWVGALLGIAGVVLISWDEIAAAHMGAAALTGLGLASFAVLMASFGNAAARKGEEQGAPVTSLTAWSMAYGAAVLALFVQLSGRAWTFEATPAYIGSLLYLSMAGSVIAFLLYFGLARRRGYGTAAYVSAMAPLLAMFVSSVMEHKSWGPIAFAAVALVLAGQVLLLRGKRA